MASKGLTYSYVVRLTWVQGTISKNYILGVYSSLKNLKYGLLDIILDLQTKYSPVEEDFARAYLSSHYQREYYKSFEEVSSELKDCGCCSMVKYCNSPDKYEGSWDSEHVAYELTIEKLITNTHSIPLPTIIL